MIQMFKGIARSFSYAFQGLFCTIREERNFRIHLVAVCFVTILSILYKVTEGQAVMLTVTCCSVLSLELINTAVEKAVDLATSQRCDGAKKAKDASATAVLVSAVSAVFVAIFIFRDPAHWAFVFENIKTPAGLVLSILFVILSLFFVRGRPRS
ncbi:MAG: diacylglycerol kinase family protein [Clostridia bacterium]|nr:diacylglycerol kinase family protein [Clostridia bacterium]MBP3300656.1 diacylglycerol kinase family protein [Clostridia bacterium]